MITVTYGPVPRYIKDAAERAVERAAELLQHTGAMPEIHISEGAILAPDGEYFSVYNVEDRHVRIGYKAAAAMYRGTGDAELIMTIYCAAHEMTHYVQHDENRLVHVPPMPNDNETYYSQPTEAEAHRIGCAVLQEVMGFPLSTNEGGAR